MLRSAACSEDSNDRKDKGEDQDDRLQRIEGHREKANAFPPSRILTVSVPAVVLLLTLGIAAAQTENSAPARKNNPVYAELAKAPKKAIARPNPLEADPDAVAAGAKLFDLHCAECHGEMAQGGKKPQACSPTKCNKRPPARFSGCSPTGLYATACPCGLNSPNRSAGNSSATSSRSLLPPSPTRMARKRLPQSVLPPPPTASRTPESLPAVLAHDERPPFATLPLPRHPIGVLR